MRHTGFEDIPRPLHEIVQDLVAVEDTAIFLASASQFARKVIFGRWFLPHEYPNAEAFEKEYRKLFGREKWVVLDIQNFPSDCLNKASLKTIYELSKLSVKYRDRAVRGFYWFFKRLPTIREFETFFQGTFESEIEFVYQHLLKTGELKKLSAKEKQGGAWKRFLIRKQKELIPYQFLSLPGFEKEVLIFLREGLG